MGSCCHSQRVGLPALACPWLHVLRVHVVLGASCCTERVPGCGIHVACLNVMLHVLHVHVHACTCVWACVTRVYQCLVKL